RLAQESTKDAVLLHDLAAKDLHGDDAIHRALIRAIDGAHRAAAGDLAQLELSHEHAIEVRVLHRLRHHRPVNGAEPYTILERATATWTAGHVHSSSTRATHCQRHALV